MSHLDSNPPQKKKNTGWCFAICLSRALWLWWFNRLGNKYTFICLWMLICCEIKFLYDFFFLFSVELWSSHTPNADWYNSPWSISESNKWQLCPRKATRICFSDSSRNKAPEGNVSSYERTTGWILLHNFFPRICKVLD